MIVTAAAPSSYPRETVEYVHFAEVTVDGEPATTFLYAVTPDGERPALWLTPETLKGKQAFLLDGVRPPGLYQVFVRLDDQTEHVVIQAGTIRLT